MESIFFKIVNIGFWLFWIIFLIRGYKSEKHNTKKEKIQHILWLLTLFMGLVIFNIIIYKSGINK